MMMFSPYAYPVPRHLEGRKFSPLTFERVDTNACCFHHRFKAVLDASNRWFGTVLSDFTSILSSTPRPLKPTFSPFQSIVSAI